MSFVFSDAEKSTQQKYLRGERASKEVLIVPQPSTAGQLQQQEIETGGPFISSQEHRGPDA